MNYLKEIIAFYDFKTINSLSTGQIALWYALMDINNKCGWREWFSVASTVLENLTGLSRSGVGKARGELAEMGLIEIRTNGTKATSYKMIPMANILQISVQGSTQDSVQDSVQVRAQDGVQSSGTLNKQNKRKQNKTYIYNYNKKSKFNNYDDDNETDYEELEERIFEEMLAD